MKDIPLRRGLAKSRFGHIHYRYAGEPGAQAVVVSHINQQSSALMMELLQALSTEAHAIAIDYPSHGMSDHVAGQPTIEDYAVAAISVMDELGIDRASVLGEATGAFVSAELAAHHPQRVERAILVNCPYYPDPGVQQRAHAPLKSSLRPSDASGFPLTRTLEFVTEHDAAHAPMHPTQSWMDRINVAQIEAGRDRWQALEALARYDLPPSLKKIDCPVLLLMGEHFHYVHNIPQLLSLMKLGNAGVIAGGRFCMTWDRAQEIGARTLAFMRGGG